MKSLFVKTLIGITLSGHAASAQSLLLPTLTSPDTKGASGRAHSLFVKHEGSAERVRQLFNLYSSSAGYAQWVNTIRNGSGTLTHQNSLSKEGGATQALRTLSLFDMYLTHGVQQIERDLLTDSNAKKHVSMDFIAMLADPTYTKSKGLKSDAFTEQGLQSVYSLVAPAFNSNIASLPQGNYRTANSAETKDLIYQSLGGVMHMVQQSYPFDATPIGVLPWFLNSYSPIMSQGNLDIKAKGTGTSKAHSEIYLPQFGVPDVGLHDCQTATEFGVVRLPKKDGGFVCTEHFSKWKIHPLAVDLRPGNKVIRATPVVIEEISLGDKNRDKLKERNTYPVVRVSTDKDFSAPDDLDLTLEFGRIDLDDQSAFGKLLFHDKAALRARGRLEMSEQMAKGDLTRGAIAKFNQIFRDARINLLFHRIALKLKRSPRTWKDNFDVDPTYASIKVIREKSSKSVELELPQSTINELKNLNVQLAMSGASKLALLTLPGSLTNKLIYTVAAIGAKGGNNTLTGVLSAECKAKENPCVIRLSDDNSLRSFFGAIVSALAMPQVNKLADNSIDNMIPGAIEDADRAIDVIIENTIGKIELGKILGAAAKQVEQLQKAAGQ